MSTWAVRYVRLGNRGPDLTRLRARTGNGAAIQDDGVSLFAGWLVDPPNFEPQDLSALSREFGEAVALAVQTVADLVVYDHFVQGRHTRGLTYAGEAGWVRVFGEPEPWEAEVLFAPSKLVELSRALEDDFTDDVLDREKAELERLWKAGCLEPGSARPHIEPLTLAKAIGKHLSLPTPPRAAKG